MRIIRVNEYYFELHKRKSYGLSYYNYYSYYSRITKILKFKIDTSYFYKFRIKTDTINEDINDEDINEDKYINLYLICG